jgi:hypothetical protein
MSDEGRALRERLGQRLSWGQVGVPEDGALLVAARAEGELAGRAWQPIETAPKDRAWQAEGLALGVVQPTLWMPLPSAACREGSHER